MTSAFSKSEREQESRRYKSFAIKLKTLYNTSLKPVEDAYNFHDFHSPPLDDGDFDFKPIILLVGQYSTGKTTFIRYLLDKDFPGMRIGPEPTTDSFHVIMDVGAYGLSEQEIHGNVLVCDKTKPFGMLSSFGNTFLSRLKCSLTDNEFIQDINVIDTPGILSGEKQKIKRQYDFAMVMKLLAKRVDRIILLFDAFKLDISDEFHEVINAIKDQHSKVRVVLNKADQVSTKELMRVYGALMWSLGKVHAYIIGHLHSKIPYISYIFGMNRDVQTNLIVNLEKEFKLLADKHNVSIGDFPNVETMKKSLKNENFLKFRKLDMTMIKKVDTMLNMDLVDLVRAIGQGRTKDESTHQTTSKQHPSSSKQASATSESTSSNSTKKRLSKDGTTGSPLNKIRKLLN